MQIKTFPATVWHLSRNLKIRQVVITEKSHWSFEVRTADGANLSTSDLHPTAEKAIAAGNKKLTKRQKQADTLLADVQKDITTFAAQCTKALAKAAATKTRLKDVKAKAAAKGTKSAALKPQAAAVANRPRRVVSVKLPTKKAA